MALALLFSIYQKAKVRKKSHTQGSFLVNPNASEVRSKGAKDPLTHFIQCPPKNVQFEANLAKRKIPLLSEVAWFIIVNF